MDDNERLIGDVLAKAFDLWIASAVKDVGDEVVDMDFGYHIRAAQALVLFRAYRRALKQPKPADNPPAA